MPVLEWLKRVFTVNEDTDTFDWGVPMKQGIISIFLAIFGPTIQAALDAGRNPVDDLCALPEAEKRGWGPDFELWKQRGIGV